MPKRPRQAHVPKQSTRKRRQRRDSVTVPADAYLDVSGPVSIPGYGRDPVGPIVMPGASRGPRTPRAPRPLEAPRPSAQRVAGQLPTFERAYLMEELRRITMTAGSLLILIVVLALVLR